MTPLKGVLNRKLSRCYNKYNFNEKFHRRRLRWPRIRHFKQLGVRIHQLYLKVQQVLPQPLRVRNETRAVRSQIR